MPERTIGKVSSRGYHPLDVSQWTEVEKVWSISRIVDAAITKFQATIIK